MGTTELDSDTIAAQASAIAMHEAPRRTPIRRGTRKTTFGAILEDVLDERGAGGVERREKLVRTFVDRWERGDPRAEAEALKRVWPEKQHILVGVDDETESHRNDPPAIEDVMAVLREINVIPELPAGQSGSPIDVTPVDVTAEVVSDDD